MKTNVKKMKNDHGNGKGHAKPELAQPVPTPIVQAVQAVQPVQQLPESGVCLREADREPIRALNNEITAMKAAMTDVSMQIWMLQQRQNDLAGKLVQAGQNLDTMIKEAVKAVGVDISQGNMRLDMDSMMLHRG